MFFFDCSITEAGQHCDTLLDPVSFLMLLLDGQPNVEHEVRRVTRRRKSTSSSGRLVDWALVRMTVVDLVLYFGNDPNSFHLRVKYFGHRFLQSFLLLVPATAFSKESIDVDTVFCWFGQVIFGFIGDHFEVKVNCINGNDVFSREVLLCTCQEGLSEVETRDPENWW